MSQFPGFRSPRTDFPAVRSDLQTTPLYYDVDLSSARSLAAGTQLELPLQGNVIYIDQLQTAGNAVVHFNDECRHGNTGVTVYPGFIARVPFVKLVIENASQPGLTLRIIYGVDIDFVPAVSPGSGVVQVVDGGKAFTLANRAFSGAASEGGVAAEYPHAQLHNTGASQLIVLRQLSVSSDRACKVRLIRYDTPLPNPQAIPAKLLGGDDSETFAGALVYTRTATNGSLLGTGRPLVMAELEAGTTMLLPLREPIVIPPGLGLLVTLDIVESLLCASFEITLEEP